MLANRAYPVVCAFRAVTTYISAAKRMRWDLTVGHLSPVVAAEGDRGILLLSAAHMTTSLQGYLRAAGLPSHFTIHSFRRGGFPSKFLTGTAVDEIMDINGWKTESVAKYYIGATSSRNVHGSNRNAARATLALASYHGRLSRKNILHRMRERVDNMLRKVR